MGDRNFVLLESGGKPYVVMTGPKRYAVVIRRQYKTKWSGTVVSVHDSVSKARMMISDIVANEKYPRRLLKVYPVTDMTSRSPVLKYV